MVAKNVEWYSNARWDIPEQEMFFSRVNRARYQKPFILRAKGSHLWRTRDERLAKEALKLFQRVVTEFPDDPRTTTCLREMALCYEFLNEKEKAIQAYRMTLEFEGKPDMNQTSAWSEFGLFVIRNRREDLYDEIAGLIGTQQIYLPIQEFLNLALSALILSRKGIISEAKSEAKLALGVCELTDSGLSHRPKIGLVDKEIYSDLIGDLNGIVSA